MRVLMLLALFSCTPTKEVDADFEDDTSGGSDGSDDELRGLDEDDDDEDADDDDGGDDAGGDADETPGYFLGQMQADTFTAFEGGTVEGYDYDAGEVDAECEGSVSFTLDDDLELSGEANCSSATPFLLQFEITGEQEDGEVTGAIILEVEDEFGRVEELETPFTGSRDGDAIELSFDAEHGEGQNRFEIDGSITATRVE